MNVYLKLLLKSALVVIIAAVLGLMLLVGVFLLPTDKIEQNLISSIETFESEGSYPTLSIISDSRLDNFTDGIMLITSTYTNDENVLNRAVSVYKPGEEHQDSVEVMTAYYKNNEDIGEISYGRYWHGYLIFTKPLLSVFTYSEMRLINTFIVAILATVLIMVMYSKKLGRYIIPYLIAFLLIDPFAVSQSIQYFIVYCIYTVASIILLLKKDWFDQSVERIALFFVLVGCCTSFFDLLTYPVAAFGIPIIFYICATERMSKETVKTVIICLIAWFIGYGGMWAGKWILGSLFGSENIILDAVNSIFGYTSMSNTGEANVGVIALITRQLSYMMTPPMIIAVAYIAVTGVMFLIRCPKSKLADKSWIAYIAICLLPIIWFLVASRHSYIHSWFTYRELIITMFAGLCMFARLSAKPDGCCDGIFAKSKALTESAVPDKVENE